MLLILTNLLDIYIIKQTQTHKTMTTQDFKIGAKVNYKVCNSIYFGEIVKFNGKNLVVIDCDAGIELFKAGYAVGSDITINQVIR